MRKPADKLGKANSVARYAIGNGHLQVLRPPGTTVVQLLDTGWNLRVTGHLLPNKQTPGQVLDALAAAEPLLAPGLVRCVDPEIERALVTIRLEDWMRRSVRP